MKLLEVCVDSLASARAAKQGGADRLEFCSALAVGGLTPYADLLRQIKAELDLPVRCLMRPRAGDFLYTRDELELLCRQIETLRSAGADGFVIGALTPEGALDLPAMRMLLDACGGAPVTLHRCIDVSRDLCATYRAAAALGIDTVLTSGGAGSCRKGISQLAALLRLRDELGGPEVLIGAGVNAAVIDELRAALPGARAFHASCKTLLESGMTFRREGVPMGLPGLDEWHIQQTDADAVCAAKAAGMREARADRISALHLCIAAKQKCLPVFESAGTFSFVVIGVIKQTKHRCFFQIRFRVGTHRADGPEFVGCLRPFSPVAAAGAAFCGHRGL